MCRWHWSTRVRARQEETREEGEHASISVTLLPQGTMLAGTLAGVEMGLRQSGIPHTEGGIMAALDSLALKSKPVAVRI